MVDNGMAARLNAVLAAGADKTPDLNLSDAQAMGYGLMILPSLLLGAVMHACDATLTELKATDQPPSSATTRPVRDRFRRFGSDEWDALRTRFRGSDELKSAAE